MRDKTGKFIKGHKENIGKYRVPYEQRNCLVCQKQFSFRASRPKRYCSRKCMFACPLHKKHLAEANKGKRHNISPEGRERLKATWNRGGWNKGKSISESTREKLKKINFGKRHSEATIKKMIASAQVGEKNVNWKGGITPINTKIRNSREYKLWRKSVFERDGYMCVFCGVGGVMLHADHIKPFYLYPELRFAIDNGRTLCVDCHKKTNTYLWKARTH